jgi:hypothetical protein
MEDITKNTEGKRLQDVEITGVPLMKAQSECADATPQSLAELCGGEAPD